MEGQRGRVASVCSVALPGPFDAAAPERMQLRHRTNRELQEPRSWSSYGMMHLATTPRDTLPLSARMFRKAVTDSGSKVMDEGMKFAQSEESSESS